MLREHCLRTISPGWSGTKKANYTWIRNAIFAPFFRRIFHRSRKHESERYFTYTFSHPFATGIIKILLLLLFDYLAVPRVFILSFVASVIVHAYCCCSIPFLLIYFLRVWGRNPLPLIRGCFRAAFKILTNRFPTIYNPTMAGRGSFATQQGRGGVERRTIKKKKKWNEKVLGFIPMTVVTNSLSDWRT